MQTRQIPHGCDRLIRLPEVESATGCKKSTIYKLLKDGSFPRPVRLSSRMVAWSEAAVQRWVQGRIEASALFDTETGSGDD
jgi:prophage regulatory protein